MIAASGRLGLAAETEAVTTLPIEERFFMGGTSTVRAYRFRQFGCGDADAGTVAGRVKQLPFADLRPGGRAGIKLTTPPPAARSLRRAEVSSRFVFAGASRHVR